MSVKVNELVEVIKKLEIEISDLLRKVEDDPTLPYLYSRIKQLEDEKSRRLEALMRLKNEN